jgi:hypothetical protein
MNNAPPGKRLPQKPDLLAAKTSFLEPTSSKHQLQELEGGNATLRRDIANSHNALD